MRFVVGVDGSESSRRAFEFTLQLAEASRAQVKCVFVRHVPAAVLVAASTGRPGAIDVLASALDAQEAAVEDIVAAFKGSAAYVTTETRSGGDVGRVLEAAAEDWGADLIVVGSRGLHGLHRLVAGSGSTGLVHRGHLPVLVVPCHQRNM